MTSAMILAVIQWFEPPSLALGPLTLQTFGAISALGVLLGARLAARVASADGLDGKAVLDFAVVGVVAGVLGGHLVHLGFYHQEELRDPWRVLKFWEGLSSMGGLLGATVAALFWFRRRQLAFAPFADAFALGLAPGWGVARVGCFTVHDHPGVRSDFFLAVDFPGGPRHDLGLYEALLLFTIAALLWTLRRRGLLRGRLLALLALLYGTGRFLLDFLRARPGEVPYADARQLGLTFAQWFSLGLVAYAVARLSSGPPKSAPASEAAPSPGAPPPAVG
jgi:phosphatidylglycerol:prolipoprotein diacylglycerol transferase